ncbi:uncharacterized protein LOC125498792 [Beta vulgaris subsp. vulgaris]|uniref:uncharacterized protein LOC125498792 n=1 Tax=Beta vulgaris subsp. vulgaris TaxID=3555 RepID=UPI002036C945|nr:uncharacterized protein LOC125498792 [Beta vulgaris subsp. vulgaris]
MEDFANASAYCQQLKTLSDQLKNVGAPVSNNRLVLQMVSGLTESYNQVATLIRQSDPLPPFYQARSMLTLEEVGLAKKASTGAAMVARNVDDSDAPSDYSQTRHSNHGHNKNHGKNRGKGGQTGRNSSGKGGGKGGRSSGSGSGDRGGRGQTGPTAGDAAAPGQWPWGWGQLPIPPSPYPTFPWARPGGPSLWARQPAAAPPVNGSAGVLGIKPGQQQAHHAYTTSTGPVSTPTDIEAAMYTLGLTPPNPNWFMDTGATSHMT